MRIVEVKETFSKGNITFKKGHKYVMAEDIESNHRSTHADFLAMSYPIEKFFRKYNGEDLNGKRIMGFRSGGIGDIFFVSPALRYLKKKYKDSFIRFATGCMEPLESLPEIDELYNMPFDAELLNDVDYHIMFQGILETSSEKSKKTHASDMFFNYFGIDSTQFSAEEKRPKLFFKEEEMNWLEAEKAVLSIKDSDYVIGLQMETSSPLRNFPKEKFKVIIDTLAQEPNTKILLIGTKEAHAHTANFYKGNHTNVIPAIKYTVRQTIILANRYDLVIAPDTFMIQTAGALEKPLIGLYGPFPSEVRMKYFKNAIGLDPKVACSPCFKHDFRACIKGYPSPCFTQIKIEDVLQAIDYQKYKVKKKHFNYMAHYMGTPDLSEIEQYFLGADKGLCFFSGYFKHFNMISIDTNKFATPDVTDLSTEFKRNNFPFVLYMNNFTPGSKSVYSGSKGMVRPGGYFIISKTNATEQFFDEIKKDIGKSFVLLYSKFDTAKHTATVVGKKNY